MTSSHVHAANAEQVALWNGDMGALWVRRQVAQDVMLGPILDLTLAAARVGKGEAVIDVGCGTGSSTLQLAELVGAGGQALGIDISAPMLALARSRAPAGGSATFVVADATIYPFVQSAADLLFSRFGVMFFADPVLSFQNLRRAMKPTGRVAFACWREPKANPWMMLPLMEAYKHVPRLPQVPPEAPGPFAFADAARTTGILAAAGFGDARCEAHDLSIDVGQGRGIDAAVANALEFGPASRALADQPADKVAAAKASMRDAFVAHAKGNTVPLDASIWVVTARAA